MSGGLFARAVAREVGRPMTAAELVMLSVGLHSGGYGEDELIRAGAFRVYSDPEELRRSLDELSLVV
jgi:phosphoglycolate phosphatase-like HAD superfamily hydrolase